MHGINLAIGSLFFISLLVAIYFHKKQFVSVRNKLYRCMLIVVVVMLVSVILATLLIKFGYIGVISDVFVRLHWLTGILWMSLLYFYCNCFLETVDISSFKGYFKNNLLYSVLLVVFIVATVCFFFFPFSDIRNINNISYIPGKAAIYVFAFCVCIVMLIVITAIINRNRILKKHIISVGIMLVELIVVFVIQIMVDDIDFLATAATLQMFFLYFMIENPDLEIISELKSTKDDIDRSNRAKSDFLSNMSHEIRTPMNAIIGFSESILDRKRFNQKEVRQDIENISTASNNLIEIINNILDISKIESGKEVLEEKEYSLLKLVSDLTDITKQRLKNRPIKLLVDVDESLPDKLYGDYTKLYQILLNLMTNAAKYTEVGKIIFTVKGDASSKDVKLIFQVKDTGFGIKKEDYDKVFGKFSRLHNATDKEIEGTGLGLVISKQYAQLLGGNIGFDSEYEVGSTFYFEVKQKVLGNNKVGKLEKDSTKVNDIDYLDCSKFNILIVDDNDLNIKVAEKLLSPYKFNITSVKSGKDCIYKIKEGNHYDLIFMDHMMPEMDGIQTLHIIKKLDDFHIPPVVALTANAITGMREMYLKEGFDEYLSKPINIKSLNDIIKKYFER